MEVERKIRNTESWIRENIMKRGIAECVNDSLLNIFAGDFDPDCKAPINQDAVAFLDGYINWSYVSATVRMSSDFIESNIDKIDIYELSKNPYLTEDFVAKHLDDYGFREELVRMFFRGSISSSFVLEHGTKEQFHECLRLLEKKDKYPWLRKW